MHAHKKRSTYVFYECACVTTDERISHSTIQFLRWYARSVGDGLAHARLCTMRKMSSFNRYTFGELARMVWRACTSQLPASPSSSLSSSVAAAAASATATYRTHSAVVVCVHHCDAHHLCVCSLYVYVYMRRMCVTGSQQQVRARVAMCCALARRRAENLFDWVVKCARLGTCTCSGRAHASVRLKCTLFFCFYGLSWT